MTAKSCPRLWEVEAAHVGRLDDDECAKQHEHQKTCGECGRVARSLIELKERLLAWEPPSDELTVRRLRQTTLQRAAALQAKRRRVRPSAIVLALALAVGAGFAAHSLRGPLVEVTSEVEPSSWSRHHSPQIERVVLREGVFSLSVRRGAEDPRVVVEIPEGEIEDVGTTFSVTVHDGHTTRIAVRQGAVLLRRAGLPTLKLLAGSVWQPVPKAVKALQPVAAAVAPPPMAAIAPPPPLMAARPARPAASHRVARGTASPPSAAAPLADEDACYLEFVQLLHQQQRAHALRVGSDYLQRFPHGFRQPDVERALLDLH